MRLAAYSFAAGPDMEQNLAAIRRGAQQASQAGARLLALPECALCGYPPVETPGSASIRPEDLEKGFAALASLAREQALYLFAGSVRYSQGLRYNSTLLFGPDGSLLGAYDKRALWGWDLDNFARGEQPGVFDVDGLRIGTRICFELRFPECFRELYLAKAQLCIVHFCFVAPAPNPERLSLLEAHLRTRATENAMALLSVNGCSGYQTAPTAFFDANGRALARAPLHREGLLVQDFLPMEADFGLRGRMENSDRFSCLCEKRL